MQSIIVGTAGHIDHGKSALVRALTGIDPDRLPDEKRRGITIDLGFADLELNEFRFGFVDVPGHERFVRNMLAGAHGLDLVLLVVAADEAVMPQTREHFDICRLLGVRNGLVVITKSDLVEEEMLPLVEEEVYELVSGSFLEGAAVVVVSARTGAGLDALKAALKSAAQLVPPRSSDFVTRLPIDRAFSMKGFGAVVTGTLVAGEVCDGDELELLPPRARVRVRGVQVHGKTVEKAVVGQRTALNLAGVEVSELHRGMVLAPVTTLVPTQVLDVTVNVLPHLKRGLRSRARVRLHIGAAEVLGRIRILESTGEISSGQSGLAQLRLESPVIALHGDHFILRGYSPVETIGGGIVINPFAKKHRVKELETVRKLLNDLLNGDELTKFAMFIESAGERGLRPSDIKAATGWRDSVVAKIANEAQGKNLVIAAGNVFISTKYFEGLCKSVAVELQLQHQREPLARGMLRETLRDKLFPQADIEVFNAVLHHQQQQNLIVADKDMVRLQAHTVDLSDTDRQLRDRFVQLFITSGLEAPTIDEAMTRVGAKSNERNHARKILQLLIDDRSLIRVHGDMLMHKSVLAALKGQLLEYASQHEPERLIDVATFKEIAEISRKYAIPLLEYFDRERVTRRAGDKRIILRV
ncbi:MAG: selenocysteine-specific translation elongation factor [Pyrinomonadaceae bacterium]